MANSRLQSKFPQASEKIWKRGANRKPGIWIDGACHSGPKAVRGYVSGLTMGFLVEREKLHTGNTTALQPADIGFRCYNQEFRSAFAMVPGIVMLMLIMIPAMMTAVGVVREKETGSIANFRSTPVTQIEFLIGKQAPMLSHCLLSFLILVAEAYVLFNVPVRIICDAGVRSFHLRACHHRIRPSDLLFHAHPNRRYICHSHYCHGAVAQLFGHAYAGFFPGQGRACDRPWISFGLVPADQCWHIHQGLGLPKLAKPCISLVFAVVFIGAACTALPKQEN